MDITFRALDVLSKSDIIYCEDTRFTNILLQKHSITGKKLYVYNDHSDQKIRVKIIEQINQGKIISLVSDAGTPLIADPGYKLVNDCMENNVKVDVIPGACAAISALILSGLPTDKFYFGGFIPKTQKARENLFKSVRNITCSLIFYDTSARVSSSINSILETLGNKEIAIVREITKIYQEVRKNTCDAILADIENRAIRGEVVLIVNNNIDVNYKPDEKEIINDIMVLKQKGLTNKDICTNLLNIYPSNVSKKELYKIIHNITQ